MRSKVSYLYASIFCIHVLIAIVAFLYFRLDPSHVLFCNFGDGLKNMFNLLTYVKEPITTEGIMKYNAFCYPFGDYVFYTDNTPLFSIPFRWFCHHVVDLSDYTIIIFQVVVIMNIIGSGLLIYYILRQLTRSPLFSYLMAIVLPWVNPQVLRIGHGHYNLSFTSLILIAICLMISWHKNRDAQKRQIYIAIAMTVLSVCSFLVHIYYFPMIVIFISAYLIIYGILNWKEQQGRISLIVSVLYPVIATGVALLILGISDKYLALRGSVANGYDWMEEKTRFTALFSHYTFQRIYFPISPDNNIDEPEKAAYLGNVGLMAVLVIATAILFSRKFRGSIRQIWKGFFQDPLRKSVFLASAVLLFVSMGEVYYTQSPNEDRFRIINILNPFFYLHLITDRVEQFRSLERFMWPFYFGFNILMVYMIAEVYKQSGKWIKVIIVAGTVFFGGAETIDFVHYIQQQTGNENYLSMDSCRKVAPLNLNPRQFQAILPIPYYFCGTEDTNYNYTIDGDNGWCVYTVQLSTLTNLPLMSSWSSRTPRALAVTMTNFVAYDSLGNSMRERLNDKPVLVAVNKDLSNNPNAGCVPHSKLNADIYWHAIQFTTRNHLQAFDSTGNVVFYKWYPPSRYN